MMLEGLFHFMIQASLFSGQGGFDLAAEWMGWENAFHCENNPFCQHILKYYWPHATSYTDVRNTDFSIWNGRIDILTGGFPCQPYSTAGKRLGKDDPRHLWPEMLRAVRQIRPRWVVGENVRGLTNWNGGMVFDEVQSDLEAEGYEIVPFLLPACAVNAPHRRDRIWFIAYCANPRIEGVRRSGQNAVHESGIIADTPGVGYEFGSNINTRDTEQFYKDECIRNEKNGGESERCGRATADTDSHVHPGELDNRRNTEETGGGEGKDEQQGGWSENGQRIWSEPGSSCKDDANPNSIGLQKWNAEQNRWSSQSVAERQGGIGSWKNFPTQSPVCIRDDGLSGRLDVTPFFVRKRGKPFARWRKESIKAAGNAIVPQIAYQIFKAIQEYENA